MKSHGYRSYVALTVLGVWTSVVGAYATAGLLGSSSIRIIPPIPTNSSDTVRETWSSRGSHSSSFGAFDAEKENMSSLPWSQYNDDNEGQGYVPLQYFSSSSVPFSSLKTISSGRASSAPVRSSENILQYRSEDLPVVHIPSSQFSDTSSSADARSAEQQQWYEEQQKIMEERLREEQEQQKEMGRPPEGRENEEERLREEQRQQEEIMHLQQEDLQRTEEEWDDPDAQSSTDVGIVQPPAQQPEPSMTTLPPEDRAMPETAIQPLENEPMHSATDGTLVPPEEEEHREPQLGCFTEEGTWTEDRSLCDRDQGRHVAEQPSSIAAPAPVQVQEEVIRQKLEEKFAGKKDKGNLVAILQTMRTKLSFAEQSSDLTAPEMQFVRDAVRWIDGQTMYLNTQEVPREHISAAATITKMIATEMGKIREHRPPETNKPDITMILNRTWNLMQNTYDAIQILFREQISIDPAIMIEFQRANTLLVDVQNRCTQDSNTCHELGSVISIIENMLNALKKTVNSTGNAALEMELQQIFAQ